MWNFSCIFNFSLTFLFCFKFLICCSNLVICIRKSTNQIKLHTLPVIVLKSTNTFATSCTVGNFSSKFEFIADTSACKHMHGFVCMGMYGYVRMNMFTLALTYGFTIIFTIALFNIDLPKTQRTRNRPLLDVSTYLLIYTKICIHTCTRICYIQMYNALRVVNKRTSM